MRGGLLGAGAVVALMTAGVAEADTLREALLRTYQANPTLTGQRAQVRSLDESVAIARALGRPQVSATAGVNQDLTRTGGGNGRNLSAGVDISYPLFTGGRIGNSIAAADERVLAGRAFLRATEGDIFTEAVGTYMDVIRDRSIVALNRNQVRVLETDLQASRDRFEVGDLTRTDVAQSEARLQLARSNLALAEGQLTGSEENYTRVIGAPPGELEPPPPIPALPATPEQAVQVALANSPNIASIQAQLRAAGRDVQTARADRLPTVSAIGSGRYTNFLGTAGDQFAEGASNTQTNTGIGVQATIPLYQGGLVGAQVRQAQALESQLLEQAVETERAVVATTRSAFATYQAAVEAIESNQIAVAANSLALEGTRAEQTVGTRNILDVLNAEQELLNSQVALVTARRDAYVAGFALLNAIGAAEVQDLNLDGGVLYDPVANYDRVSRRASDWGDDPVTPAVATRTVYGPPAPQVPALTPTQLPPATPQQPVPQPAIDPSASQPVTTQPDRTPGTR